MTERLRFDANLKWLFTERPFLERFDAAAAAGFSAVEFASPYEYPASDLRRRLNDAGLKQILINTPAGAEGSPTRQGAAAVPGAEQEYREGLMRALEYATELGAGLVHAMAGIRPADVTRERSFATLVANVAWSAEQAHGTGVRLVLEAINKRDSPGFGLESMETAATVADIVGVENVGILFDVYHAQVDRGDVVTRFLQLLPNIAHVQVADNPGRHEPGSGEIGYSFVFDQIAASGYLGWIGCEYAPAAETELGLSWIHDLAGLE
jgi:hydroxypyruvate isomerase